jgi:hypothetical protein
MYCSQCSVVSGEKEGKASFEVPDTRIWDVAQYHLVKGGFPQESIVYIFRIEQWKNNGILFTKCGNLCLLFQIRTTYSQIQ